MILEKKDLFQANFSIKTLTSAKILDSIERIDSRLSGLQIQADADEDTMRKSIQSIIYRFGGKAPDSIQTDSLHAQFKDGSTHDFGQVEDLDSSVFQTFKKNKIVEISLPSTLKTLDPTSFYEMTDLTSLSFHEDCPLESLEDETLTTCRNLIYLKLGKQLKRIGKNCFVWSFSIRRLLISKNIETIGDGSFSCLKPTCNIEIYDDKTIEDPFSFFKSKMTRS